MTEQHDCFENGPLLSAYVDGQLSDFEMQSVQDTLVDCSGCKRLYNQLLEMHQSIKGRRLAPQPAPDRLWKSLVRRLEQEDIASKSIKIKFQPVWAVALLLIAVIAWGGIAYNKRPVDLNEFLQWQYAPPVSTTVDFTDPDKHAREIGESLSRYVEIISLESLGYHLITVEELPFGRKQGWILRYRGPHDTVLLYLLPSGHRRLEGDLTFCPVGPPRIERRKGNWNAMAWQYQQITYILVSEAPYDRLEKMAQEIAGSCTLHPKM